MKVRLRKTLVTQRTEWLQRIPLSGFGEAAAGVVGYGVAQAMINGDIELAREHGAGLHLRATQLAELDSRPVAADVMLSASCHDLGELRAAEAA